MATRCAMTMTLAAATLHLLVILAPLAAASTIALPPHSPAALRQFAEAFALPMLDAHTQLSLHTVVLSLVSPSLYGDAVQPWQGALSRRCSIDLQPMQQHDRQHLVALCSWQASADTSHFITLQSMDHPASPPPPPTAFLVLGSTIKILREGLTWLMRHTLLHTAQPPYGWIAPLGSPEPWTSLRSTQFPTSMTTMPMPQLQQ